MAKKNPGNRKPTPPTAAQKAAQRPYQGLDMRKDDPCRITAPIDATFRHGRYVEDAYVQYTNDDRYGDLIDCQQEDT